MSLCLGVIRPLPHIQESNLDQQQLPQQEEKRHHYMVMGEVVHILPGETDAHTIRVNAAYFGKDKDIRAKELGQIQEALVMSFHEKMARQLPTPPDVVDVVLHNMVYLGHYTRAEFLQGTQTTE